MAEVVQQVLQEVEASSATTLQHPLEVAEAYLAVTQLLLPVTRVSLEISQEEIKLKKEDVFSAAAKDLAKEDSSQHNQEAFLEAQPQLNQAQVLVLVSSAVEALAILNQHRVAHSLAEPSLPEVVYSVVLQICSHHRELLRPSKLMMERTAMA